MNDTQAASTTPIPLWRSAVVLALGGLTVAACLISPASSSSGASGVKMQLPVAIQGYTGLPEPISEAEKLILPPDTEFARKSYSSPEGDRILCSIVLSGAEKRSIHRPEICLPGQGWTISSGQVLPVTLPSGRTLNTMHLHLTRTVSSGPNSTTTIHSSYIYWFVGDHKTTPHHWQRILWTSWDRVLRNINHRWAYVIVTSLVTDNLRPGGKDASTTLQMLTEFIRQIVPRFQLDEMKNEEKPTP